MMNEIYIYLFALMSGIILGIIFYYGLWLTVEKLTSTNLPALHIIGSALLRMGIALFGFYFILILKPDGQINRLILLFAGFNISRFVISKMIQKKSKSSLLKIEVYRAT